MMNGECKVPDVINIPLLFLVTKTPFWPNIHVNRFTHVHIRPGAGQRA